MFDSWLKKTKSSNWIGLKALAISFVFYLIIKTIVGDAFSPISEPFFFFMFDLFPIFLLFVALLIFSIALHIIVVSIFKKHGKLSNLFNMLSLIFSAIMVVGSIIYLLSVYIQLLRTELIDYLLFGVFILLSFFVIRDYYLVSIGKAAVSVLMTLVLLGLFYILVTSFLPALKHEAQLPIIYVTSIEDCMKINDTEFRDSCYYNLGTLKRNSTICEHINDQNKALTCLQEIQNKR